MHGRPSTDDLLCQPVQEMEERPTCYGTGKDYGKAPRSQDHGVPTRVAHWAKQSKEGRVPKKHMANDEGTHIQAHREPLTSKQLGDSCLLFSQPFRKQKQHHGDQDDSEHDDANQKHQPVFSRSRNEQDYARQGGNDEPPQQTRAG